MKVRLFLKMRIKQILEPQVSGICFLHYGKVRRKMQIIYGINFLLDIWNQILLE